MALGNLTLASSAANGNLNTQKLYKDVDSLTNKINDFELEYAAEFMGVQTNQIKNSQVLYDIHDKPSFALFVFSEGGYLILYRVTLHVPEFSYEAIHTPYDSIALENAYYLGCLSYLEKTNDGFVDLSNGVLLDQQQVQEATSFYSSYCEEQKDMYTQYMPAIDEGILSASDANPTLVLISSNSTILNGKFGKNTAGTCGVIGIDILLRYYNVHTGNTILSTDLTGSNSDKLHQTLLGMTSHGISAGSSGQAFIANTYLGTNDTLHTSRIDACYKFSDVENTAVIRIDSDLPVVISFAGHPTYGDHAVVAYGYVIPSAGGPLYFYVHDGWHSSCNTCGYNSNSNCSKSGVMVNASYTGVVWFEKHSPHTHSFNSSVLSDPGQSDTSTYIWRKCSSCLLVKRTAR